MATEKKVSTVASKYNGRIFRTLKNFGPYLAKDPENGGRPSVFDFDHFCESAPIKQPKLDGNGKPLLDGDGKPLTTDIDVSDTYHDDLIDRGIALGAIVEDQTAIKTVASGADRKKENPIREATASVVARQEAAKAAVTLPLSQQPAMQQHGGVGVRQ